MAVKVPDTNTFSLQDVYDAVNDHANPSANLNSGFDNAENTYFDNDYNDDSYAPDYSLKRFRNYGPSDSLPEIFVPEGFSPNNDGVHDYFEVYNLEYYPVHKMMIYNSSGTKLYERTNNYDEEPWDGKYNGSYVSAGNYVWVLEVNGTSNSTGTVMVAY